MEVCARVSEEDGRRHRQKISTVVSRGRVGGRDDTKERSGYGKGGVVVRWGAARKTY